MASLNARENMRGCGASKTGSRLRIVLSLCMVAASPRCICQAHPLVVSINPNGQYSISQPGAAVFALTAGVAAEVDDRWLHSSDYPKHMVQRSAARGYLGAADEWDVTWSGLNRAPDLVCRLRAYNDEPFADIQVTVQNTTGRLIHVQDVRVIDAPGRDVAEPGASSAQIRVLSDSFSEDRPAMKIRDLADSVDGMHRAVGSQLIYDGHTHESLFVGALTSDRFLTILRLHVDGKQIASYEVDSTGTTELEIDNSLERSSAQDRIQLSLPASAGANIASERVLVGLSHDYHNQLETYGSLIKLIHHARTTAPPLMGWWSWTAFYFGLNEGAALTNAEWESQRLRSYGYMVFHIDEGYQYARGEYTTPNATLFPHGMRSLEYKVCKLGLLPGIWTAPFEVSERSWVYIHHPDWLVKNKQGQPIHAGTVVDNKDALYILDTTNPGAADYLRNTYSTLAHEWGIRYIKMDFMDDSAVEGYYYKPDTTALEAQRIGLQIIRDAVGNDVYLDKDGSVMMNPVGYVDYGRISQDTGHSFEASKDAATGIAARYYMNRNFFVSDPDAFTVSKQIIADQSWNESKAPLKLNEARVSVALAAVSGGMLEIGDNLPSLENSPERISLIENEDLINMTRLGRASVPIDLMDYSQQDGQPSMFFLKESKRQSILTVFNWTEQSVTHTISLSTLGIPADAHYTVTDVLENKQVAQPVSGVMEVSVQPRSVTVLKLIDRDLPPAPPVIAANHAGGGSAGEMLQFSAQDTADEPATSYEWDFGDGVKLAGDRVSHAWTEPGDYDVHITATGLDGESANNTFRMHITGHMPTRFDPGNNRRYP
jgi:alpha-galactosidase